MVYEDYLMRALSGSEKRETVFDGSRFLYAAVTFVTASMTQGIFPAHLFHAIMNTERTSEHTVLLMLKGDVQQ